MEGHHGHDQQGGPGDQPEGDLVARALEGDRREARGAAHVEGVHATLEGDQGGGEREQGGGDQDHGGIALPGPDPMAVPEGPDHQVHRNHREGPEDEEEHPVVGDQDPEGRGLQGEQGDGQQLDVTVVPPRRQRGAEEDHRHHGHERQSEPVRVEVVGRGDRERDQPVVLLHQVAAGTPPGAHGDVGDLALQGPDGEEEGDGGTRGAQRLDSSTLFPGLFGQEQHHQGEDQSAPHQRGEDERREGHPARGGRGLGEEAHVVCTGRWPPAARTLAPTRSITMTRATPSPIRSLRARTRLSDQATVSTPSPGAS